MIYFQNFTKMSLFTCNICCLFHKITLSVVHTVPCQCTSLYALKNYNIVI
uniref:Uncharacterized protein n=1 Tax=Octopus bimaculoides TaxID=37653 RepID=A0A0L8I503_OCTBM